MQSVQRHFGKYMKRTADEGQISVLLKDFDDADQLLTRVSCLLGVNALEPPSSYTHPDLFFFLPVLLTLRTDN
jgi:hypothetical protein